MWRNFDAAFYGLVECKPHIENIDVILITNCNKIYKFLFCYLGGVRQSIEPAKQSEADHRTQQSGVRQTIKRSEAE